MFLELMPLLAGRTVLITVAKLDDRTIRVNAIPTLAKADENPALTTPLAYTGPPEELDAELGKHLTGYAQTHQQTASTLAEAKATLEVSLGCGEVSLVGRGSQFSTWPMPARPSKTSSLPEMNVEELVMETHRIHPELLERQVRVLVVGYGGTGSAVVAGLPYLH